MIVVSTHFNKTGASSVPFGVQLIECAATIAARKSTQRAVPVACKTDDLE